MPRLPVFPLLALSCFVSSACSSSGFDDESIGQKVEPIIGGVLDTDQANDAVVHLTTVIKSSFGAQVYASCTGSLIAPNVVLTARHCVTETINEGLSCDPNGGTDVGEDYLPNKMNVWRGYEGMSNKQGKLSAVKKIIHDGALRLCAHDIALLILEEDDVTGEKESQIPIVPLRVRVHKPPTQHELFTATGYGLTNPNDSASSGTRYRRDGVEMKRFDAGSGKVDFVGTQSICQGDSGGPAISADGAVMGVASRGANCTLNGNVWARTDVFKDIIDQTMREAGSTYTGEEGRVYDGWPMVETCSETLPCREGFVCTQGFHGAYCTKECAPETQECPQGSTCDPESLHCRFNETCTADNDCAAGTACIDDREKYCASKCDSIRVCADNFTCDTERGVCLKARKSANGSKDSGGCAQQGGSGSSGTCSGTWLSLFIALGLMRLHANRRSKVRANS